MIRARYGLLRGLFQSPTILEKRSSKEDCFDAATSLSKEISNYLYNSSCFGDTDFDRCACLP